MKSTNNDSQDKTFAPIDLRWIHKWWLKIIDGTVVPFLRSKMGMYIILGIIIWIILY